jgi:hypothetical protein
VFFFVDILVLMSIVVGLLSIAGLPVALRNRLIQSGWKRAAQRLSLEFTPGHLGESDVISGGIRGFGVTISNQHRQRTRIVVDTRRSIPDSVRLRRSLLFADFSLDELLLTGDGQFDRVMSPRGRPIDVMPQLDKDTRKLLVDIMLRHNFTISEGLIVFEYPAVLRMEKQLESITHDLLRVASALTVRELPDKLRSNALDAAEPVLFRRRNLELLIAHHPRSAQTFAACASALSSDDPEERLIGAMGLESEPDGLEATRAIAEDQAIGAALRTRALQHLVVFLDDASLERVLRAMARTHDEHVLARIAVAVRERRIRALSGLLVDMLVDATPPALAIVVAQALAVIGVRGEARIERALLELCAHDHPEVKRSAAAALGRVGTLASVEPLIVLTKTLLGDHTLKRIAKESVREIQSEHPRGEAGVLSLADGDGRLSVAQANGSLALSEE